MKTAYPSSECKFEVVRAKGRVIDGCVDGFRQKSIIPVQIFRDTEPDSE